MLKQELLRRNLPALPDTREEMITVIKERLFGELPSPAFSVSVSEPTVIYDGFADRTVTHSEVVMTVTIGEQSHSFHIDRLLHKDGLPRPTVLLNNFDRMGESRYFPIEEMSEYDINFLSEFFVMIHWAVYQNNGIGSLFCKVVGQLFNGLGSIVFAALVVEFNLFNLF